MSFRLLLLPALLLLGGMLPAQLPGLMGDMGDKVSLSARFMPEKAAPGSEVTLEVTATIAPGWHLYGSAQDPELGDPTRLILEQIGSLVPQGSATIPPGERHEILGLASHWVQGSLVAKQTFQVPAATVPGTVEVGGKITYMACTELMCDPPAEAAFSAVLQVTAEEASAQGVPSEKELPPLNVPMPGGLNLSKVILVTSFTPETARPGEIVTLEVLALVEEDYHLYGSRQNPDEGDPTRLFIEDSGPLEVLGEAEIPAGEPHESLGIVGHWIEGDPILKQQFRVPASAGEGSIQINGTVAYMACTELFCDPPAQESFLAFLPIEVGEPREEYLTPAEVPVEPAQMDLPGPMGGTLWALILAAVGAGLFALMMPCTYPMIPITFSFFTKQAEVRGGKVLPLALTYGAGIVVMFVLIGLFVGPIIVAWATHWVTNLLIGLLFFVFALVLFGLVNLQPPQFLLNMGSKASSQGGYLGVFLMGITLVFATFTCTVPLVGALLTVTGQSGGLGTVTIGMAVFGLTMALPFVILSLVPTRIRAMPRSGEWMHVLKVFLGFVELAAALKFFSNVEYVLQWQVLPRELFLVLWGGIFFVAGIFLLGMFRLQGESQAAIGPGRMLGAMATVVFSFYCLFGALGYQLDYVMTTIAPPYRAATLSGGLAVGGGGTEVAKGHTIITDDHDAAVAQAISENKLVMVNFTGYL